MTQTVFAPLLNDETAQKVTAAFQKAGFEIRFIGGCVRDSLMKRTIGDVDLATTATPDQTKELLQKDGIKAIPTGIEHGTVTAHLDGRNFEITTLRRDIATDGRHAQVSFTTNWQEDATRRDFTINALSVDTNGKLYDYYGGQKDLDSRQLRFIGDASARIAEDYLRILRYFRFAAQFAWELKDQETLKIIECYAPSLKGLSRERIQSELFKLLTSSNPMPILQTMCIHHIFDPFFKADLSRLGDIIEHEIEADPFRRLWALGPMSGDWLEQTIVPTRIQKKRIQDFQRLSSHIYWPLHKKLYYFGAETVSNWAYLTGEFGLLNQIHAWKKPTFPVKAADLPDLSGAALGTKLKQLEEYWVDQKFKLSRQGLLDNFT
jgi:poly(A) polymerase